MVETYFIRFLFYRKLKVKLLLENILSSSFCHSLSHLSENTVQAPEANLTPLEIIF